jgi:hypothetical protein
MEVSKESINKNVLEYKHTLNLDSLTFHVYVLEVKNESKVGVVKLLRAK